MTRFLPAPPVVIVGNFDDETGTSTTSAIELVTTLVADRIGTDAFTLIEFYPRVGEEFTEVQLRLVEPRAVHHGRTVIEGAGATGHEVTVRFADPDFRPVEALELLLGEDAVASMRALAARRGEYTAKRAFGTEGARRRATAERQSDRAFEGFRSRYRSGDSNERHGRPAAADRDPLAPGRARADQRVV